MIRKSAAGLHRRRLVIVAVAALLILTGCSSSRQARNVQPGGFLGEHAALLSEGERGEESLLVYEKERTDWTAYDKVMLDPVTIWSVRQYALSPDQEEDLQKLADVFQQTLIDKLSRSYTIVEVATPGALRIQTAVVNGAQANNLLKVATLLAPYGGIADMLWTFATGKAAFVGEASLEYMIRDSQSGELLAAGADRRVGGNRIGAATFTTWGDLRNILEYWSDFTVYRLCVDRGGTDCEKPSASIVKPAT